MEKKSKEAPEIIVPTYNQDVWLKDADLVELRHQITDPFRLKWEVIDKVFTIRSCNFY